MNLIKNKTKFGLFFCLLLLVLLLGCTTTNTPTGDFAQSSNQSTIQLEDFVKISLNEINNEARFYEYEYHGTKILFFVVKASDGSIKTAFDACDVCFSEHKGYRQEGNDMVCNNCGNKYSIDGLGKQTKGGGGCWPGYLPNKVIGNEIVISKKDLENGENRFL
ncbi:MAG: DUF2318 domain-containing protein [Candidatus ainarchaeum sp.]|nr:DUF2318 domain-containing protein [Candidatus ainarchaeum sp.]